MKKKIFTLCLFAAFILNIYSQSFQYQAIVSDNNTTLVNTDVSVRFTIREKTATGTKVYSEVHQTKTNSFGMVALQVGKGTVETGDFTSINWGKGSFFHRDRNRQRSRVRFHRGTTTYERALC